MSRNITEYTNEIIKTLKNVARDNAIREGSEDEGFNVVITKDDIKNETGRSRIKEPVFSKIVDSFNSSGMDASEFDGQIEVFVPPALGKKDCFTLKEIKERENIIEEINLHEQSRYEEWASLILSWRNESKVIVHNNKCNF